MVEPRSSSTRDFTDKVAELYRDLFEDIETEDYPKNKLVQRIEFLEDLDTSDLNQESLEKFSKSILDARALAVITEGKPNEFQLGDREKLGGTDTIEFWFLKGGDSQANNKLLEVLVQSWYKENDNYEIEDFEDQKYDVEKEVDFRLLNSKELIECKRISGEKEGATRNQLKETKEKLEVCKKEFSDHTGHLIIDLGTHSSELSTTYEEFSKKDFEDKEINEIKSFIKDEIENTEEDYIDKVTICWLGAYINENTWYSLHKTIEETFSDRGTSSYDGWTIRREKTTPGRSTIVISSDNKSIQHAKAGYDASPEGGQTFFNWSGAEPTGDKGND
jgi:hypothetical protein